jgi:hypothetical protein
MMGEWLLIDRVERWCERRGEKEIGRALRKKKRKGRVLLGVYQSRYSNVPRPTYLGGATAAVIAGKQREVG